VTQVRSTGALIRSLIRGKDDSIADATVDGLNGRMTGGLPGGPFCSRTAWPWVPSKATAKAKG
jgi:hypothetical protein